LGIKQQAHITIGYISVHIGLGCITAHISKGFISVYIRISYNIAYITGLSIFFRCTSTSRFTCSAFY